MSTNMLECPACDKPSDMFLVTGTLVTGEMSVRIGPNGTVMSTGPVRPKSVIKPGHELRGRYAITCPFCNHTGRPDTFRVIMSSVLSGVSTDKTVNLPYLGVNIPICIGEEGLARDVFTTAAFMSWENVVRVDELLGLT